MVSTIRWGTDVLELAFRVSDTTPVLLSGMSINAPHFDDADCDRVQPLVELLVLGDGHALSNTRFSHTGVGARLRHIDHEDFVDGVGRSVLRVHQSDARFSLEVTSVFRASPGVAAVQTWTEVRNSGAEAVVLQMVSSFASGAFLGPGENIADVSLLRGRSEWCGESRWAWTALHGPDGLPDINTRLHDHDARGALTTVSKTTWSSGQYLPTGVLENTVTGRSWAWQIEHNGAWRWEVDGRRDLENALAVIVSGPTDIDHQWSSTLGTGEGFTTSSVSVAVANGGYEVALGALTDQRRAIRRYRDVDAALPVIFNDYMNTLMGDPTTEKLLPLIDAASAAGADYFCIDAGWYDDGGDWWPSVGEWKPSSVRFPDGGLARVIEHICDAGMQPGLWLEPEVVGVRSPMAESLPREAFLQRYGQRVVEHDRYHLDLRHPAAIEHLDRVIDYLVNELGARYFKLDYNVTPGAGTDLDALSAGEGLLDHNRAHLAWLDGILDRYPDVIFENCASGAMRLDYAMMSRLDLQSTSDQQDFRLYATIAAAAPASLLPEQAGNWAYPQPGQTDEEIAFNLVTGLAGRLYLSGKLDGMSPHQAALVAEGVSAYKAIRSETRKAKPWWPFGLPGWYDDTVALGLAIDPAPTGPVVSYLVVWNRSTSRDAHEIPLKLPPALAGKASIAVETVYPASLPKWGSRWDPASSQLTVTPASGGLAARVFRLSCETE